eukprot:scaffold54637_cov67-Phaeocystis_antarctica.AAC.1
MRISKADAPRPFPLLVSEPSLGTGLKNTSRAPSAPTSTPTVGSSAGADSARTTTYSFHAGCWQTYLNFQWQGASFHWPDLSHHVKQCSPR